MVQNSRKRRGRPPAYDPSEALGQAAVRFWRNGFSGTSLDDLGAATGMNRPSLYGAFGDKRALYLKALTHYRQGARPVLTAALRATPLETALRNGYEAALAIYGADQAEARGCLLIGTALTEAMTSADVRELLLSSLAETDALFAERIQIAIENHELTSDLPAAMIAKIASATLHSLAVRCRAGAGRAELESLIEAAIRVIFGANSGEPAPNRQPPAQSS